MSVQKVTQAIYQAIAAVKELDHIKTNIQTASGVSDAEINGMIASYNQIAKHLSLTTKEVGNTANEIVRMGESLSHTNKLIESSSILAKIGMLESSKAVEYLISSMNGFQVSSGHSMEIIDKLAGVDMRAAVSAGGLAEAMSKCADIANSSGTSMDRLIGYMAAVGKNSQDSMSVIGDTFHSMYSRMNNNVSNRNFYPTITGGLHITCPGVTSSEVMKQVGIALQREFHGLSNKAIQESMLRK